MIAAATKLPLMKSSVLHSEGVFIEMRNRMFRFLLGAVLLVTGSMAAGQNSALCQTPSITLRVPPGIPSESVQINYFLTGDFGGYGDFIKAEKDKSAYVFVAGVEGKPAASVKIIAYLPGCEIITLAFGIEGTALSRDLACKPLRSVQVRGQISPASILENKPAEIQVAYLAFWDHKFFGIADGIVTRIHIATVIPDQTGRFEVDVPDLHAQNLGEGEFQFTLRAVNSWNLIASLESSEDAFGLPVLSSYPQLVTFIAKSP
jgi:hypothetical protein